MLSDLQLRVIRSPHLTRLYTSKDIILHQKNQVTSRERKHALRSPLAIVGEH
jgi:hypothetical protein